MEVHEPSVGEILDGKVSSVLASPLYNCRRDRKGDHAMYVVLGLNNMKDLARALGKLYEARSTGHVFCSTLKRFL